MTRPLEKEEPVYQQLARDIRDRIRSGGLEAGSRLPSMRDLAKDKGVSLGTVRHVYALLGQEGLIELRRGQGTFIRQPRSEGDLQGRKDRALAAIDRMMGDLEDLGFSSQEARIFIDLRLRQKEDASRPVRIGLVAGTAEERAIMASCLDKLGAASLTPFSFQDLSSQPERLEAGFDLLLVPPALLVDLKGLAPDRIPVLPVALRVSHKSLADCRKIIEGGRTGILCLSEAFGQVMEEACGDFLSRPPDRTLLGDPDRTAAFLAKCDQVLLPPHVSKLAETADLNLIREAEAGGKIFIRTHFECDQGSLLYLEEAIKERYQALRGRSSH